MKGMRKLFAAMALAVMVAVLAIAPVAAYGATDDAADSTGSGELIAAHVTDDGVADSMSNDELFAAYVDQQFAIAHDEHVGESSLETMAASTAYNQLDDLGRSVYKALQPKIQAVAKGEQRSTAFTISLNDLPSGASSNEILDAIGKATDALMEDCPYELYWYDKSTGVKMGVDSRVCLASFYVSADYSESGSTGTNTTRSDLSSVTAAIKNAGAIVEKHKSEGDYAKLDSYRSEICDLVSYNDDAASNSSMPYGNPWQLIWVFDGDPTTNVVCEGYAKAFKYLCDCTFDNSKIACYTVNGIMSTGGASVNHMWNLVTVSGKSYLTDITNCDTGTIGSELLAKGTAPGKYLFMKGYSAVISDGYRIDIPAKKVTSGSVTRRVDATSASYVYDSKASTILGANVLKLSDTDCPTTIDGSGDIVDPTNVKPQQAVINKLTVGKKQLTVTVKDQKSTGITGYQIKYRVKGASTWKTKTLKASKTSLVIKKLKTGKKYQVKARGYVTASGKTTYGKFSKTKTSKAVK